ncbi:MAG: glycosyltransferase family 87 protein [Gallionella sp.]
MQADDALDFHVIWIAGKLWLAGQNPYGNEFATQYSALFVPHHTLWVYPPYWFPITTALALLPFPAALILWKTINLALLVAATHLTARAFADEHKYWPVFLLGLSYACLMQSTAGALSIGQTSILVYFGLAAMVFGLLKDQPAFLILGLIVLALKPNFGLVAFAATASLSRYRWTIIPAGLVCVLGAVPILIGGHIVAEMGGFLSNLASYSVEFGANTPSNMTGIVHLLTLHHPVALTAVCAGLAAALFYSKPLNAQTISLFVASIFFIVQLHAYDAVAIVIVLMALISAPVTITGWLVAAGLLICFRPGNLASVTHIMSPSISDYSGNLLLSLGFLVILAGTVVWVARPPKLASP